MGAFQAGLLVPVAVGPVIGGGALAGSLGWRSVFWFLFIYGACFLVLMLIFFPETLRSLVGSGSQTPSNPFSKYPLVVYQKLTKVQRHHEAALAPLAARKQIDITGPFRILFSKFAAPLPYTLD